MIENRFLISAFADEHSDSFDGQLAALRGYGLSLIELRFIDGKNIADLDDSDRKNVKEKLGDAGISVSAIGSPLGKINLADDFSAHFEKARRVFDTANFLGTDNIRVFSFYLHEGKSRDDCREEVLDKFGRMADLADDFGVTLCHENEAKIYGESPERCLDLLSHFSGRVKCVFDMGNFVLDGYKPYPYAYNLLKDYIRYFHIKDSLSQGAIVPAGCGEASIGEILHAYRKEYASDVLLSIEPHLETFGGLNKLVGKSFENPYRFESKEAAFTEAVRRTKEICGMI